MNTMSEFNGVMKFAVILISILNPIGDLPIFPNFTNQHSDETVKEIAKLGPLILNIMTRIMGIILLAISIERLARGLKMIFIDFA